MYRTGEEPAFGDVVRGVPNCGTKPIVGLVVAHLDGTLAIVFLRPGSELCETARVYGEAKNFDLIGRNE